MNAMDELTAANPTSSHNNNNNNNSQSEISNPAKNIKQVVSPSSSSSSSSEEVSSIHQFRTTSSSEEDDDDATRVLALDENDENNSMLSIATQPTSSSSIEDGPIKSLPETMTAVDGGIIGLLCADNVNEDHQNDGKVDGNDDNDDDNDDDDDDDDNDDNDDVVVVVVDNAATSYVTNQSEKCLLEMLPGSKAKTGISNAKTYVHYGKEDSPIEILSADEEDTTFQLLVEPEEEITSCDCNGKNIRRSRPAAASVSVSTTTTTTTAAARRSTRTRQQTDYYKPIKDEELKPNKRKQTEQQQQQQQHSPQKDKKPRIYKTNEGIFFEGMYILYIHLFLIVFFCIHPSFILSSFVVVIESNTNRIPIESNNMIDRISPDTPSLFSLLSVEKVLDARYSQKGELEAYVKWKGDDYPSPEWVRDKSLDKNSYDEAIELVTKKKKKILGGGGGGGGGEVAQSSSVASIKHAVVVQVPTKKRSNNTPNQNRSANNNNNNNNNNNSAPADAQLGSRRNQTTDKEIKEGYVEKKKNGKYYEVQEILDRQVSVKGKIVYSIRWVGYPKEGYEDTWEPPENLNEVVLAKAFRLFTADESSNEDDQQEADKEEEEIQKPKSKQTHKFDGKMYYTYQDMVDAKCKRNENKLRELGLLGNDNAKENDQFNESNDRCDNGCSLNVTASEDGSKENAPNNNGAGLHQITSLLIDHEHESTADYWDLNPDDQIYDRGGDDEIDDAGNDDDGQLPNYYDSDSEYDDEFDDDIDLLAESNYAGARGAAEMVYKRKTLRIGQSYYTNKEHILTILTLFPCREEAECIKYIPSKDTWIHDAKDASSRQEYFPLGARVTIPLCDLKKVCESKFPQSEWFYEYDEKKKYGCAFYKRTGRIPPSLPGKSKPTVLELFAGAGGMCLGFQNAGFETKWAVDKNDAALSTLKANFKTKLETYTECVRDFIRRSQLGDPAYPKKGEVDHVHTSPPCQGYSGANRYGGANDENNNRLSFELLSAIRHFEPKTATFENVFGLLWKKNIGYFKSLITELMSMGYQVRWDLLDSSDYGDPQQRKRVILWAAKPEMHLPKGPRATHGLGENMLKRRTVKDAIGCLEEVEPFTGEEKGSHSLHGVVIRNHCAPISVPRTEDYILKENKPSRTVMGGSSQIVHYNEKRYLSVRECACLQSFPWEYQFFGSLSEKYQQVGNAVPVNLSTHIARSVAQVYGLP
jgi:DNA (cytosine-5)-methyltransferase 1